MILDTDFAIPGLNTRGKTLAGEINRRIDQILQGYVERYNGPFLPTPPVFGRPGRAKCTQNASPQGSFFA